MKITAANIYIVETGSYRLPVVELLTDEGLTGIGEAAVGFGVGTKAAATMIAELAEKFVLGRDPNNILAIWNDFYFDTFWGKGAGTIFYGGVSALEMALWDIKGKTLNVPVYQLLGGKLRDEIPCYANDWCFDGPTPLAVAHRAEQVLRDGYTAIKLYPLGHSDENSVNRHIMLRNVTKEDERACIEKVRLVREAIGDEADLLVDVTAEGTPDTMIRIGRNIEPYNPFYYEEPLDAFDVDAYAYLKSRLNMPIAAGERLYTRYGFRRLIESRGVDIVQPDPGTCGGVLETWRIASMAEAYQMRITPHNCGGPILTAACVQLAACLSNFLIQEIFPYRPDIHYNMVENPLEREIKNSKLPIPTQPGLGVRLNHQVVDRFQIARLQSGI